MSDKTGKWGFGAARTSAVMAAADVLEGIARTRRAVQTLSGAPPRSKDAAHAAREQRSDLLFDLLRLNASYLTELGNLSRTHRDHVVRTLETTYAGLAGCYGEAPHAELSFTRVPEVWSRTLRIENNVRSPHCELHVHAGKFEGPKPSRPIDRSPRLSIAGVSLVPGGTYTLPFRQPVELSVQLDRTWFERETVYRSKLTLYVAEQPRVIVLKVDNRGPQS